MLDPDVKRLLQEQGIVPTTWREMHARRQVTPPASR
jgi:hypothetical protein